jgi:short-subunit dehydrogenase
LEALQAIAETAWQSNTRTEICQADLTLDKDIDVVKSAVQERFGRVDLLVHSAGIFSLGLVESTPVTALDDQYRVNVRAPFVLTQALLPMVKQARGQIVFINSTAGLEARAKVGHYAATKHALRGLTDSLREEVNPAGVRVLSLFLGRTATPMQEAVCRAEGRPYQPENFLQPEDVAKMLVNVLSLPRTAEVTDIRIRPAAKSY